MSEGVTFGLDDEKYIIEKLLGSGSYGVTVKAFDRVENRFVAIKQISNVCELADTTNIITREIRILHSLRHDSILSLLDVQLSNNSVYIITECCDMDLTKLIKSEIKISRSDYIFMMYQVLHAIDFMHLSGILHRDIKPANILVNSNYKIKLCDFGLARVVENCDVFIEPNAKDLTEYVVSRWYRAPEIVLVPGRYGKAQDIWGAACTFAEMILRRPLFPGASVIDQLHIIVDVLGKPTSDDLSFEMTSRARRYVEGLESMSANTELDAILIAANKIHKDLFPLLRDMLQFNPHRRISSKEACNRPIFNEYRNYFSLNSDVIKSVLEADNSRAEMSEYSTEHLVELMKIEIKNIQIDCLKYSKSNVKGDCGDLKTICTNTANKSPLSIIQTFSKSKSTDTTDNYDNYNHSYNQNNYHINDLYESNNNTLNIINSNDSYEIEHMTFAENVNESEDQLQLQLQQSPLHTDHIGINNENDTFSTKIIPSIVQNDNISTINISSYYNISINDNKNNTTTIYNTTTTNTNSTSTNNNTITSDMTTTTTGTSTTDAIRRHPVPVLVPVPPTESKSTLRKNFSRLVPDAVMSAVKTALSITPSRNNNSSNNSNTNTNANISNHRKRHIIMKSDDINNISSSYLKDTDIRTQTETETETLLSCRISEDEYKSNTTTTNNIYGIQQQQHITSGNTSRNCSTGLIVRGRPNGTAAGIGNGTEAGYIPVPGVVPAVVPAVVSVSARSSLLIMPLGGSRRPHRIKSINTTAGMQSNINNNNLEISSNDPMMINKAEKSIQHENGGMTMTMTMNHNQMTNNNDNKDVFDSENAIEQCTSISTTTTTSSNSINISNSRRRRRNPTNDSTSITTTTTTASASATISVLVSGAERCTSETTNTQSHTQSVFGRRHTEGMTAAMSINKIRPDPIPLVHDHYQNENEVNIINNTNKSTTTATAIYNNTTTTMNNHLIRKSDDGPVPPSTTSSSTSTSYSSLASNRIPHRPVNSFISAVRSAIQQQDNNSNSNSNSSNNSNNNNINNSDKSSNNNNNNASDSVEGSSHRLSSRNAKTTSTSLSLRAKIHRRLAPLPLIDNTDTVKVTDSWQSINPVAVTPVIHLKPSSTQSVPLSYGNRIGNKNILGRLPSNDVEEDTFAADHYSIHSTRMLTARPLVRPVHTEPNIINVINVNINDANSDANTNSNEIIPKFRERSVLVGTGAVMSVPLVNNHSAIEHSFPQPIRSSLHINKRNPYSSSLS